MNSSISDSALAKFIFDSFEKDVNPCDYITKDNKKEMIKKILNCKNTNDTIRNLGFLIEDYHDLIIKEIPESKNGVFVLCSIALSTSQESFQEFTENLTNLKFDPIFFNFLEQMTEENKPNFTIIKDKFDQINYRGSDPAIRAFLSRTRKRS